MAIRPFLAMTAAEIHGCSSLPEKAAWMACHFSPYGLGLSNLPRSLPPGALLMVDDITPICGHDPQMIAAQLRQCAEQLHCAGVLLDFQRPDCEETAALVEALVPALPCPVAVSHFYAGENSCAVCLPPVPPSTAPEEHLASWQGRELWLELSREAEAVTVTEEGATVAHLPPPEAREGDHFDDRLLCHYRQKVREEAAVFTLYRTDADLQLLLAEAEHRGVTRAVGLHQEFQPCDTNV